MKFFENVSITHLIKNLADTRFFLFSRDYVLHLFFDYIKLHLLQKNSKFESTIIYIEGF